MEVVTYYFKSTKMVTFFVGSSTAETIKVCIMGGDEPAGVEIMST